MFVVAVLLFCEAKKRNFFRFEGIKKKEKEKSEKKREEREKEEKRRKEGFKREKKKR